MDTFIDKLAQKRNAQEMIRANSAAEALKMEQMQKQLEAYDGQMQKQMEAYDRQMQKQAETYDGLMQELRRVNLKTAENAAQTQELLKECMEKLMQVQAADGKEEGDAAQTLEEMKKLLQEQFDQSNDFLHRENVKVYRNVQAALVEELNKQTQELKESQTQNKGSKALLPVCVAILIGVAADLVINLLPLIM
ncbi:MAG: hypothetical protein J6A08_01985 [Lachnospiraceae bacterium]|nr:hypothetical protein [Lachnospiraceae bacterium]